MELAAKMLGPSAERVVIASIDVKKDITPAALFLAFVNLGERIKDDTAVSILPTLISNIAVNNELIDSLRKTQIRMDEIAHSLMLNKPKIFCSNENNYDLFD